MAKHTLFKSRLARRFFTMFISCALIPIIALSIVTYYRASRLLHDQAIERLQRSAKAHGLSIFDRLLRADNQLQIIQAMGASPHEIRLGHLPTAVIERNQNIFSGLSLFHYETPIVSWASGVPEGVTEALRRLRSSEAEEMLTTAAFADGTSAVIMLRRLEDTGDGIWFLAGTLAPGFLWGVENGNQLPPAAEFCIQDDQGQLLFNSFGPLGKAEQLLSMRNARGPADSVALSVQGREYIGVCWTAFLKYKFQVPFWDIIVMEPLDFILQPLSKFQMIFPLIVLVAIFVVILMSSRAIHRSLQPIEALMEGARNVSMQHFNYRVTVESNDEFKELAGAFNAMSIELDAYFKTLLARNEMDQIILSVLDDHKIIQTGLQQLVATFQCQTAAIGIIHSDDPSAGNLFIGSGHSQSTALIAQPFHLLDEERLLMAMHRSWVTMDAPTINLNFLKFLKSDGVRSYVVLPIWIRERLFALAAIGIGGQKELTPKEYTAARRLCDHLAVAFSNTNLIDELKALNIGTLLALARTVDAKSSWTAGHSDRVTRLAVKIGTEMGLSQTEQDDLQRAGLLHDIGKIGIPSRILDKNGKLTAEEYALIQKHPGLGAEIMRPIRAYTNILPIVEQHHEKFDGTGYPKGLSGSQIHPLARIVAVADTFDAMVSDRPYRKGLVREKALQIIRSEAGRQFDPAVVDILFGLEEWMISERPPSQSQELSPEEAVGRMVLMASTSANGYGTDMEARG